MSEITLTWSGLTQGLHTFLQTLIDAEATQLIGADPFQRTDTRTTHRNGTPGQGRLPGGSPHEACPSLSPGHLRMALVCQALLTVQQQSASRAAGDNEAGQGIVTSGGIPQAPHGDDSRKVRHTDH